MVRAVEGDLWRGMAGMLGAMISLDTRGDVSFVLGSAVAILTCWSLLQRIFDTRREK